MITYTCPSCRAVIPLDDINVAADLALCRACGETTSFVSLAQILPDVDLNKTPKYIRVERSRRDVVEFIYRKRQLGLLVFFIPFTCLWGGGSMIGIYGTQIAKGQFDLKQSLFGLPFLFGTIFLLSIISFMIFGAWRFRLEKSRFEVFVGVGRIGWRRRLPIGPDSRFSIKRSTMTVNDVRQNGIELATGKEKTLFAASIDDESKNWLASALEQSLELS